MRRTTRIPLRTRLTTYLLGHLSPHALSVGAIASVALVLMMPMLINGVVWGHDTVSHVRWTYYFAEQLSEGDLYPRWLLPLNDGFGSPAFYFYPPLAYYLTSPFYVVGGLDPMSSRFVLPASLTVSFFLAGCTMYLWLRRNVSRGPALGGAVLYMALPYHATIDASIRVAFSETWAFAWIPLIFVGSDLKRRSTRNPIWITTAGAVLLVLTHPPAALMSVPVAFCYASFRSYNDRSPAPVWAFSMGLTLAVGLCAFYLIPAFALQRFLPAHWTYFDFHNCFLFLKPVNIWLGDAKKGVADGFLATWAVLTLVVALIAALVVAVQSEKLRRVAVFIAAMSIATFLIQTPISVLVWEVLPLLDNLQFPWRFGVVQDVLTAFSFGLAMQCLIERSDIGLRLAVVGLLVVVAAACFFNAEISGGRIGDSTTRVEEAFAGVPEAPEYELGIPPGVLAQFEGGQRARFFEGEGVIEIVSWRPDSAVLRVAAKGPALLGLRRGYFTGWWVNSAHKSITISEKLRMQNLVGCRLDSGEYLLTFRVEKTIAEVTGMWISVAAVACLLLLLWRNRSGQPPNGAVPPAVGGERPEPPEADAHPGTASGSPPPSTASPWRR